MTAKHIRWPGDGIASARACTAGVLSAEAVVGLRNRRKAGTLQRVATMLCATVAIVGASIWPDSSFAQRAISVRQPFFASASPRGMGPGFYHPPEQNKSLNRLIQDYDGYDCDADGFDEIVSFSRMAQSARDPSPGARVIVVFVESRLLDNVEGARYSVADVHRRLSRLHADLKAENYAPKFVEVSVYDGPVHQDGKTVLALRDFLRDVQASYPNLEGALLIGDFPESMLVRQGVFKKDDKVTLGGVQTNGVDYVQAKSILLAHRSDIVLADLDGHWDEIYEQNEFTVVEVVARPNNADFWEKGLLWASEYKMSQAKYRDAFFIADAAFTGMEAGNGNLLLAYSTQARNLELSAADSESPNPIAIPDILVARINPRHIAVEPDPNLVGPDGKGLVGDDGKPQATAVDLPNSEDLWVRDARLERRLLIEYLDRNHRYRNGWEFGIEEHFRAGAIARDKLENCGGDDGCNKNSTLLGNFDPALVADYMDVHPNFGEPLVGPVGASLLDYVNWLREPAIFRGVLAHSNSKSSSFNADYDPVDLEAVTGTPWRWIELDGEAVPTFENQGKSANFYLHRTLWENGVLEKAGSSFFIHQGCEVNTPAYSPTRAFNDDLYGHFQNAEGQLFYLNGLAILSRAKVASDRPEGWDHVLVEELPFGEIWRAYFESDAEDTSLTTVPKHYKRSYVWSLNGDWSVVIRP